MKNYFVWSLILVGSVIGLNACTGTFTIRADYDKQADFAIYKTYNYLPGSDSLMGPGSSRIKSYTEEYLDLLGYKKADNPDLFVSINGKVQQRLGTTTNSGGYGGYGGYGYGGYYGWDSYSTSTYVYNQTTIVIDLVDVKKHQLVWQGAATGEFDQYSLKDKKLHQMVDEIFGQYPFSAGTNQKRALLYGKYYKKPTAKK
jgi:hypothetical protein